MGSTLAGREHGIVNALLKVGFLGLLEEDQSSAGSTESLVAMCRVGAMSAPLWDSLATEHDLRGGADHVAVLEGVVDDLSSYES